MASTCTLRVLYYGFFCSGPVSLTMPKLLMTDLDPTQPVRPAIWPVLIAPIVGILYYLPIIGAFAQSMTSALPNTSPTEINLGNMESFRWGSHWIYRCIAEVVSVSFGTYIAAGIAHGRERLAAIIAGSTISLWFLMQVGTALIAGVYFSSDLPEPWYQNAISTLLVLASPLIGTWVAGNVEELRDDNPQGFPGINLLHFTWLWIAGFFYAWGLIPPFVQILMRDFGTSGFASFVIFIVHGISVAIIAIPGYFGILLLAGHLGEGLNSFIRNIAGVMILVVGFIVGALIQNGWYRFIQATGEMLVD